MALPLQHIRIFSKLCKNSTLHSPCLLPSHHWNPAKNGSVTPRDSLSGPAPHRRAVQQDADQGTLSNTCFSCYNHTSQITARLTCGHGWAASFWNRAHYRHAAPLVVRSAVRSLKHRRSRSSCDWGVLRPCTESLGAHQQPLAGQVKPAFLSHTDSC